jgi:DNA invertase Pin-like site-specific DNA recombinase/transposase
MDSKDPMLSRALAEQLTFDFVRVPSGLLLHMQNGPDIPTKTLIEAEGIDPIRVVDTARANEVLKRTQDCIAIMDGELLLNDGTVDVFAMAKDPAHQVTARTQLERPPMDPWAFLKTLTYIHSVTYSRKSTKHQKESSISRQQGRAAEIEKRYGWINVGNFTDSGMSGRFTASRPEYQEMLTIACQRGFNILVVENLDRPGRKLKITAELYDKLRENNVLIYSVDDGVFVTLEHIAIRGVFAERQVEDMMRRMSDGRIQRALEGCIVTSLTTGYERSSVPGKPTLNKEAKQHINDGMKMLVEERRSLNAICDYYQHETNFRTKFGNPWTPQSLCGSAALLSGLFRNPLPAGISIYGRTETHLLSDGNVSCRVRSPLEWLAVEVPEYACYENKEIWIEAQAILGRRKALVSGQSQLPIETVRRKGSRAPAHPLSGLLKCRCGANYTLDSHGRIMRCSNNKTFGTCQNTIGFYVSDLLGQIIEILQRKLLNAAYLNEFERVYERELKTDRKASRQRQDELEREIADLQARLGRLKELAETGVYSAEEALQRKADLIPALNATRAEAAKLKASTTPISIKYDTAKRYREIIASLSEILSDVRQGVLYSEAVEAFQDLLHPFYVDPREAHLGFSADVIFKCDVVVDGTSPPQMDAIFRHHINFEGRQILDKSGVAFHQKLLPAQTPFALNDDEWALIEPLVPKQGSVRGRVDDQRVLSAILWHFKADIRWVDLPPEYGSWRVAKSRYDKWLQAGHLRRIFRKLIEASPDTFSDIAPVYLARLLGCDVNDRTKSDCPSTEVPTDTEDTNPIQLPDSAPLRLMDEQWNTIVQRLPASARARPATVASTRALLDAVLMIASDATWACVRNHFGDHGGLYNRVERWAANGWWDVILPTLVELGLTDEWPRIQNANIPMRNGPVSRKYGGVVMVGILQAASALRLGMQPTRSVADTLRASQNGYFKCGAGHHFASRVRIRNDISAAQVRYAAKQTSDPHVRRQLLAIAGRLEGMTWKMAAMTTGSQTSQVRDWVRLYNAAGLSAFDEDPTVSHTPRNLTREQEADFINRVRAGPVPSVDLVSRWSVSSLCDLCAREYGVVIYSNAMKQLLNRLAIKGYRNFSSTLAASPDPRVAQ